MRSHDLCRHSFKSLSAVWTLIFIVSTNYKRRDTRTGVIVTVPRDSHEFFMTLIFDCVTSGIFPGSWYRVGP